jgi:acyl dehydratase
MSIIHPDPSFAVLAIAGTTAFVGLVSGVVTAALAAGVMVGFFDQSERE